MDDKNQAPASLPIEDLGAEIGRIKALPHFGTADMLRIMHILRHRCPWDMEQTHGSIRKNFIEECYEACEAIDRGDAPLLREELGDVMLQVAFHCEIEAERGSFDWDDVCDELCRKLILRHPHVFGEVHVDGSEQVLQNWEQIKHDSKEHQTGTERIRAVASTLPALMRAQKIQKRASDVEFDKRDADFVIKNIYTKLEKLQKSCNAGADASDGPGNADIEAIFGDLLFDCVRLGRKLGFDCEEALICASNHFADRFEQAENAAIAAGKTISDVSGADSDIIWHSGSI